MNDLLENTLLLKVSGAGFERSKYVAPRVELQRLPDIVCGASGRGDDLQTQFDPAENPRPGNQPKP
jgi:hypothetical protein